MKNVASIGLVILLAAGCSEGPNPVSFTDYSGHGAAGDFSEYELIPIGSFNTNFPVYLNNVDINESGTVVGSGEGGGGYYSFIWTFDDGFQVIPSPSGSQWFQALTINDNGVIGGSLRTSPYHGVPAITTGDGQYTVLNTNVKSGVVWGINNTNQAAGQANGRAFFWSESTPSLNYFGAWSAKSINESGQVVGETYTPFGKAGYIWSLGAPMTIIPDIPADSKINDINNNGDIAGTLFFGYGEQYGFYRSADGIITNIGTLEGGISSWATSINDHGQVVGYGYKEYMLTMAPFTWSMDSGIVELPALSEHPSNALAINNSGTIAGRTVDTDGTYYACIWTLPQGPQTPEEYILTAIDLVENLISTEILGTKDAKPLIGKLDNALNKLVNNNIRGAIGSLNAAENQVNAMINSGKLTEEQAAPLLEMLATTIVLLSS